jgi:Fe-S-cluster-containing dehydrogenase component/formate-dependent nitrite reductase membrane component NrfD
VQLGFVIDHSRCIGCHACTVACKSENQVPVGSFRTWVKYTEQGEFPTVKRSFAVLRCNQCTDAPCVTICPVTALEKRPDGIVDVDPDVCIGCKACMHACPYDALYINEGTGTAEKCHFCAHRTELGLAPACAVVCPTEAIIPGDFHDPESRVSRLRKEHQLTARKVEAGTGPNVFYRDVAAAGIDPLLTNGAGGYIWSDRQSSHLVDAETFSAMEKKAEARTVYDVPRKLLWNWKITGYLFAKSLSAGIFPAALIASLASGRGWHPGVAAVLAALFFLGVTGLLLIADLKRPERFIKLFLRPNWNSWLARGTFVIAFYGTLLASWLLLPGRGFLPAALALPTALAGLATAGYTGLLFAQAKGRVLWMNRGLTVHLLVQAMIAGCAYLLLVEPLGIASSAGATELGRLLAAFLGAHLLFLLLEERLAPRGREKEYRRASRFLSHGKLARTHWSLGVGLGIAVPIVLLLFAPAVLTPVAAALALVGLWIEEDLFVRAGQAQTIS